ncbi:hypothetical protein PSTT_06313, partial [Puccinia striiformis]
YPRVEPHHWQGFRRDLAFSPIETLTEEDHALHTLPRRTQSHNLTNGLPRGNPGEAFLGPSRSFYCGRFRYQLALRWMRAAERRPIWEYGAQSEVLLELHYQDLSVYSTTRKLPLSEEDGPIPTPQSLLDLIDPILARRDPNILPLVEGDGSAGDPASLGIAVLVARQLQPTNYRKLAEGQLDWSMNHVPRCPEGAISQRNDEVQFWADFMYMLPPFLAYYGAATSNITLLQSAYDQVRLYRQKLQTSSDTKLWSHIIGGSYEDRLYWSTGTLNPVILAIAGKEKLTRWAESGNGWAAAGMMRVYATFNNLRDPGLFAQTETWRHDLAEWVLEITTAAFTHQQLDTELIPNYMLTTDPKRNYPDCSGTALIASAAYRLASLEPSYVSQLPMNAMAKSRIAIFSKYTNITTGAVGPVVDPMDGTLKKLSTVLRLRSVMSARRPSSGTPPLRRLELVQLSSAISHLASQHIFHELSFWVVVFTN